MHDFMKTGRFTWEVPFIGKAIEFEFNGKPPLDFWGVNYYGRCDNTQLCIGLGMNYSDHVLLYQSKKD